LPLRPKGGKSHKKMCGKNGAFFPFARVEKATRRSAKIKKKHLTKKREEKLYDQKQF